MALTACYECGGKISTTAAACPHCGAPSKIISVATAKENPGNDWPLSSASISAQIFKGMLRRTTRWYFALILVAASVIGFLAFIIRTPKLKDFVSTSVSFINGEGDVISCPPETAESCVRDAERKGLVRLSDAVAGISVDWKQKPLRIIDVKGTAAEAGIRKGDILIEVSGRQIQHVLSLFKIMSIKRPGDNITVKVSRAGTDLYFAYNLMPRQSP